MVPNTNIAPLPSDTDLVPELLDEGSGGTPIIEHPDGYYWIGADSDEEFGPYETCEQARAARDAMDADAVAPLTALSEAEIAIGISDWIDTQTGEPAEGQSPPHLEIE